MLAELSLARGAGLWRQLLRSLSQRGSARSLAAQRTVAVRRFLMATPASAALYLMFQSNAFCAVEDDIVETGTASGGLPPSGVPPDGITSRRAPPGGLPTGEPPSEGDDNDAVKELMEKYGPVGGQIGFGWVTGVVSGYALKRIGEKVAFVLGLAFIAAQGLAYSGVIDIKWAKLQEEARKRLDADGDGDIDRNDLTVYWAKFKEIMTYNLPAGGGYAAGVATGLWMM